MTRFAAMMSSFGLAVLVLFAAALPAYAALPTITSFSPAVGKPGDTVTITGTGFSAGLLVMFNTAQATFLTVNSATLITTQIPIDATTGPITVITKDGKATSNLDFSLPPAITSFTPTKGPVGTEIIITGTNFTPNMNLKFTTKEGVIIQCQVVDSTTIITRVPSGGISCNITVSNSIGSSTSAAKFYVEPTITGFTPSIVDIGTTVTITGTNFTGATAVRFNNVLASTFTVNNDTYITAIAPVGASAAKGYITVTTPGGTAKSPNSYCFLPTITMIQPGVVMPGETFTVSGTNFIGAASVELYYGINYDSNGGDELMFDRLQFSVINDTTMTVTAPASSSWWTGRTVHGYPYFIFFDIASTPTYFGGTLSVKVPDGISSDGWIMAVQMPTTITATVNTGANYVGLLSGVKLNYTLNGENTYTGTLNLDNSGIGHINAVPGIYNMEITGNHWLKRKITNVDATTNTAVNVSLANGDANGDGQVNLFDFVILDAKFGTTDTTADLDGDGHVNLFDYTIVDQHFGSQGDL